MTKKFYLVNTNSNKSFRRLVKIYIALAKVAIKYGTGGRGFRLYTEDKIREFLEPNDMDFPSSFTKGFSVKTIRWFIHNVITIDDPIWNADFFHGLMTNTKISWNQKEYPTAQWESNPVLLSLLQQSPYGGTYVKYGGHDKFKWIPALYLKYSKDSISYLAGVLAGGQCVERDGYTYAMYKNSCDIISSFGIPIEKTEYRSQNKNGKKVLISPFWPSLLSFKMPPLCQSLWREYSNAFNAELYAEILWKTYVDTCFIRKALPYLKCSRAIYYKHNCEEGAMKKLEKLRIEKKLVEIDLRFQKVIQEKAKIAKDNQNNKE